MRLTQDVTLLLQGIQPAAGVKSCDPVLADHMDKRGRQHRTWPGAGRNGSTRPPDSLVHSRSAPLPNDLIVSLLPSGTEVLFALGLGSRCSTSHRARCTGSLRAYNTASMLMLLSTSLLTLCIRCTMLQGCRRVRPL